MKGITNLVFNIYYGGSLLSVMMVFMLYLSVPNHALAQSSMVHLQFKKPKTNRVDIRFELIHNLIIVPVFINNSDTLKFILDTGVSHTMITSLKGSYTASFNYAREINLFGLGQGNEITAYHSFGNVIELPGVIGFNHNVIILKEEFDYLSQGLGTKIHGLLGYDLFDSFTVEIDYKSRKLTLYDPQHYRERRKSRFMRKAEVVPLEIEKRKPYVRATVLDEFNEEIRGRLLVDCGASHAITLFPSLDHNVEIPDNSIYTFIGVGLSGDIYGHIGRAKRFEIGRFRFRRPLITYPDEESVQITNYESGRTGSIGADILKRFTVVFDYRYKEMFLRPNSSYKDDFTYNLSGIDLMTPFPDIPVYQITKIRKGSPAWIAGLEVGDQIVSINGLEAQEYDLSNIIQVLQSRAGRTIHVGVRRENEIIQAKFTLEDPIK